MEFLRRLFGGGQPGGASGDGAIHIYVRCNRCQSPVHVRVDPRNDLIADYGDDDSATGYALHKEIMDARCFRIMRAEILYDQARRETGRTIEGGTFISEAEYHELAANSQAPR